MLFSKFSLRSRLWLALAIVLLPLVGLTIRDYRIEFQHATEQIEREARLMIQGVQIEENASLRDVGLLLRTMALADNMRDLDPDECSGLSRRLITTFDGFSNIGAALPTGEVFCAALPLTTPVNVTDRRWFQEVQQGKGLTKGYFLTGKISGKPGIVFGFPLSDKQGNIRAALFAASDISWFDRFTKSYNLPENWISTLFSAKGDVLSRFPDPALWRDKSLSEESRARFVAAVREGRDSVIMTSLDGIERLYVLAPVRVADEQLIISVAAPINETQDRLREHFWLRIGQLIGLTLCSILLGRFYLYRLIETWLEQMKNATDKVAQGEFSTRIPEIRMPSELEILIRRFNEMTKALQDREKQNQDDRQAIESLNQTLAAKLATLELAEADLRRLSTAVEQSPASIVITDINAKIIFVNEAFQRSSGYTAEEVLGANPSILHSGETPRATYDQLWPTLLAGKTWSGEFMNRRKDGSCYLELATISPVRDEQGAITHYVAVKEDITERRRNEAELAAHRQHLEQLVERRTRELAIAKETAEAANRSKSEFLANMSHEIRTPMNAIIGLNYLLQQTPLDPAQHEKLLKVSAAAKHLLKIINDILDLSKIEAGKLLLERNVFSPVELLQAVGALVQDQVAGKGLKLEISSENLPARALGDATRLRQVLLNFAGNAIKFTQQGSITISGQLLGSEGGEMICRFAVSDTGIGISADDCSRLFNAFEQLDGSTTRRFGGTGLGLAIARHLAQLMGGDVGVESNPGAGSCFWITTRLGATGDDTLWPEQMPSASEGAKALRGAVLLAEDEPINREIAIELLGAIGLQVETAENGVAAVAQFAPEKFDLILMDVQMPQLSGLDATRQIRQLPGGSAIPIIALTADAFLDSKEKCFAAGMTDFISKPVDPDMLYAVLARYLPEAGAPVIAPETGDASAEDLPLAENLARLAEFLAMGDAESTHFFARLKPALKVRCPVECEILSHEISTYNFEAALLLLGSVQKKIQ